MTRVFKVNYKNRHSPGGQLHNKKQHPRVSGQEMIQAIHAMQLLKKDQQPMQEPEYINKHTSFNEFAIEETLKKNIAYKGYTKPTPIQDQAIPLILEGKDVIGIANTGTGKTAAFLIPLVNNILHNRTKKICILTPTRELAVQINDELKAFAHGLGIISALCIGGANIHMQKIALRQHPQFVIGTPGRIKDLIKEKSLDLSQFTEVVLDEADRMVDIGFIHDIRYFISLFPKKRQSLFFSATISGNVKEILHEFIHNGITVSVKQQDIAQSIDQNIIHLNGMKKIDRLHDLLTQPGFEKVLIFGRTKWGVQKLTEQLQKRGFKAAAIHGNKSQNQRLRVLEQFKKNEISILLATDVASRGLDINDVSHVINYDMPESFDDYVHRIGRTGRANKKGIALTFVN
ncbi:MAG: DEAD/DEAH box helicase [Patescibacteria group bacterium]|nr:DEAD/DEAH box helicase [Patescibacteria group bacterium]